MKCPAVVAHPRRGSRRRSPDGGKPGPAACGPAMFTAPCARPAARLPGRRKLHTANGKLMSRVAQSLQLPGLVLTPPSGVLLPVDIPVGIGAEVEIGEA